MHQHFIAVLPRMHRSSLQINTVTGWCFWSVYLKSCSYLRFTETQKLHYRLSHGRTFIKRHFVAEPTDSAPAMSLHSGSRPHSLFDINFNITFPRPSTSSGQLPKCFSAEEIHKFIIGLFPQHNYTPIQS
jgi:hypothetical protein